MQSVAKAKARISWLTLREVVASVARHLGCTPDDAELRIVEKGKGGLIRACGLTVEGWPTSPLPAAWRRGIDWDAGSLPSCGIANITLRHDDLIAEDLLPGRSEVRNGWLAAQTLAWIIRREAVWTPEMGKEIRSAQLRLSEAIAARRINLWGRRPGSPQREPISNDLFSLSKYKVIVTLDGKLSTEPLHKRHRFEADFEKDSGWHDIIFAEDEIRCEWLPAGRAGSAPELVIAENGEISTEESAPRAAVDSAPEQLTVSPGPEAEPELASPAPAEESMPEPSKPEKLPVWLKTVDSPIAAKVRRRKRPYDSLADLRKDVEKLLEKKQKAVPQDRTMERGLTKHRPEWFINRGRKGDAT
jgi:hypothetical protein